MLGVPSDVRVPVGVPVGVIDRRGPATVPEARR
jgi:hypothetical protein